MADKQIQCVKCGENFIHSERDQKFYDEMGFTDPKTCYPCRQKKKNREKVDIY